VGSDFLGDTHHFYRSPCKNVLVALKEVDEITFLFGAEVGPTWMVMARSSVSICMALASSVALKVPDVEGMAVLAKEGGALRHNSFSSAVVTTLVTSSMLFCSQSNARWALTSMLMTLFGPGILSLK
jgi:hypothetical protein